MPITFDDEVRIRAYLLWISEGRPEGRDKDHWFMAVSSLAAEAQGSKPRRRARAAGTTAARRKAA